jgi:hypothetical protein
MSENQNQNQNETLQETRSIARKLAREITNEELESIGAGAISCSCGRADDCCQY